MVAMSADKILAALVVAACAVMLLRLALGARRRRRFDAAWYAFAQALRSLPKRLTRRRARRRQAEQAADAAIRRAQGVDRDGNVYTPESFRRPRKPH
jgi:hypothetical protein